MKTIKYLIIVLSIVLLQSCSTDNQSRSSSTTQGSLIGTWIIQSFTYQDQTIVYNNIPCRNNRVEYKTNSQVIEYNYVGTNCSLSKTFNDYIVQDNVIIIGDNIFTIVQLTSNTLIVSEPNGREDTYLKT